MVNADVDHIVWDWNGTLLDDVQSCVAAINRMLARRGLPLTDIDRYREVFGFPVQGYYVHLGFNLAVEDWTRMAREFHDDYADTARDAPLRPGAGAVLDVMRGRGIPMSILSACETGILKRMIAERGVDSRFQHVWGLGDLFAESKIDLGRRMLKAVGMNPATVLLVGDTVHDYEVARQLGCRVVLVAGGHQSERRLRACGCPIIDRIEALGENGAAARVETV